MKKVAYSLALSVLFFAGLFLASIVFPSGPMQRGLALPALADDDEEEEREDEDDEEDEDDDREEEQPSSSSSSGSEPKTETVTTFVKLPDQIVKRTVEITIYDSDGDGIFDPDDATPNIHDVFLAKDDNFNGIADEYEGK